jgi:hypothetical protein
MTLYYTLVFLLLVAEMTLFMLLIIPLPFTLRRRMFTYDLYPPLSSGHVPSIELLLTGFPTASSPKIQ